MMAVAPVLVARSIGRWNSSVRMREMFRCCVDRDGVAEPADVADVGEQRRRLRRVGEAPRQFLAEQVFVSRCSAPRVHRATSERRRVRHAAVEVAERDVHHLGEPAKAGRDEFAERHQVQLVVAVQRPPAATARRPSWCSRSRSRPAARRPGPPAAARRSGCAARPSSRARNRPAAPAAAAPRSRAPPTRSPPARPQWHRRSRPSSRACVRRRTSRPAPRWSAAATP